MTLKKLSPKQENAIFKPFKDNTLEVYEGGIRSGKTTTLAMRYALFVAESKEPSHMVFGYTQTQAFKLVFECDGFGLIHLLEGGRIHHDDWGKYYGIDTPNGYKRIYFAGGGKSDDAKRFRGLSLGSCLFTEIDLLHPETIQEGLRRTVASSLRVHFADLNPPAPNHPIISDVFNVQNLVWSHWTLDDNPAITSERKEELRKILIKNPYLYKRDFLGERVIPQGVIYGCFDTELNKVAELPKNEQIVEMFFTGDGGIVDATCVQCYVVTCIRHGSVGRWTREYFLYNIGQYYYSGGETGIKKPMSIQAKEVKVFIEWCRDLMQMRESHKFIDPACLVFRQELEALGETSDRADNNAHDVSGGKKGIVVGIERAQNIINDRRYKLVECPNDEYSHYHFMREVGMYVFDDKGQPVDAYNHCMDCLRYATNYFWKNYIQGV